MPLRQTLASPGTSGPPDTAVLHLSGIAHQVFPQRNSPVYGWSEKLAGILIDSFGRAEELQADLVRTGNSFIEMSDALLAQLPAQWPELDAVLLAYHSPDLFRSEVAGCYLAGRLPGSPVPCSVVRPGPGAAFTALRIAEGMRRLGEMDQGALFVYDQNVVVWEAEDPAHDCPDSAAVLQLGGSGELAVSELAEVPAGRPGGRSTAEVVAEALERHPDARFLAGAGLQGELAGTPLADRVEAAPALWSTSVWAGLAQLWPVRQPLLLADYEPVAGRVHSCLLVPGAAP